MPGVDSQGPDEISEMEPSYFPTVDREDPLQEREGDPVLQGVEIF